ncbi:hypothetical protein ABL78_8469 [Leptomonas seymouri]|uniref:Uncharacterized protein n=1 Tax=Leptomonas seymouri TaxID=5684 RepID=A0A0N1HY77_LEPSE|nr:hypothetical protein ABL78_8469 [Leptomonas seymouri]|eukprot:KPI82521.1 hypothetical protein ABL78_8469 [Leptomonas seymouri]
MGAARVKKRPERDGAPMTFIWSRGRQKRKEHQYFYLRHHDQKCCHLTEYRKRNTTKREKARTHHVSMRPQRSAYYSACFLLKTSSRSHMVSVCECIRTAGKIQAYAHICGTQTHK